MFLGLLPLILSVATCVNAQVIWSIVRKSTNCSESTAYLTSATDTFLSSCFPSPCQCDQGRCSTTVCVNYTFTTWPTIPSNMIGYYRTNGCFLNNRPRSWSAGLPGCHVYNIYLGDTVYFSCNPTTGVLDFRTYSWRAGGCPEPSKYPPVSQCEYPNTCSSAVEPFCSRYYYSTCPSNGVTTTTTTSPSIASLSTFYVFLAFTLTILLTYLLL